MDFFDESMKLLRKNTVNFNVVTPILLTTLYNGFQIPFFCFQTRTTHTDGPGRFY